MSVMPTSGVPHGLRSRRKRAWLCRLQNQTGRPVSGWRLIGDWAFCTACSRIGRPSAPQSISRSMSNFGATAPSTSSPSLVHGGGAGRCEERSGAWWQGTRGADGGSPLMAICAVAARVGAARPSPQLERALREPTRATAGPRPAPAPLRTR
eukprot:scaffold15093_cov114-Isochrysis_galbana.AAC.4